jgi:hypothetical protein
MHGATIKINIKIKINYLNVLTLLNQVAHHAGKGRGGGGGKEAQFRPRGISPRWKAIRSLILRLLYSGINCSRFERKRDISYFGNKY